MGGGCRWTEGLEAELEELEGMGRGGTVGTVEIAGAAGALGEADRPGEEIYDDDLDAITPRVSQLSPVPTISISKQIPKPLATQTITRPKENLPPVATPPRLFNFGIPPANIPASCGAPSPAASTSALSPRKQLLLALLMLPSKPLRSRVTVFRRRMPRVMSAFKVLYRGC